MTVLKATNATIDAIRKCSTISRDCSSVRGLRKSSFCMESSDGRYRGPFMVNWYDGNYVLLSCPEGYMGDDSYAGSICTPDMLVVSHIKKGAISYEEGSGKTLLVLKTEFYDGTLKYNAEFVPDPWTTCSEADKTIVADTLNPVTASKPRRDPLIGIYPIARIAEDGSIVQLQYGHIIDYGRWWMA